MKWLTVGVLAVMLCLPLFVVFSADDMYNRTQDAICRNSPGFSTACQPYQNRYERVGIISTAFFRHLSSLVGRESVAEPSFAELLRQEADANPKLTSTLGRAEQKLSTFTRNFVIALGIASALAGAALLYSIQRIHRWIISLKTQPVRSAKQRTPKPKVTRSVRAVTAGSRTAKSSARTSKSGRSKNSLPKRSSKATTKPKKPETIRPRASH